MAGEPRGSASNAKWTEINKTNRMIMPQRLIAVNNKADDNHSDVINHDNPSHSLW